MSLTTTDANATIQEQVANVLVEPLEAESVVLSAGARIFDSSEPLRIPTITAGVNPEWVGEGEVIPEDEATFGEIALMPTNRKSIKTITRVTNELVRAAKTGVSEVLQARLVKDVATKLDTALLKGDGVNNSVTGLLNQPGVQTTPLDSSNPDSLLDALALASAAEVNPTHFFLSGADFFALRKIKDADGRYIMQSGGGIDSGVNFRLFDVPVVVTNKLVAGEGALVDMQQVAIVRDIDPQITILNERYAEFDETGIRVVTRYDLGLLHPEGVIKFGTEV